MGSTILLALPAVLSIVGGIAIYLVFDRYYSNKRKGPPQTERRVPVH